MLQRATPSSATLVICRRVPPTHHRLLEAATPAPNRSLGEALSTLRLLSGGRGSTLHLELVVRRLRSHGVGWLVAALASLGLFALLSDEDNRFSSPYRFNDPSSSSSSLTYDLEPR